MKKKVVIVTRKMIMGGVEKALIAMLKKFNYEKVEVDLYVEQNGGELFDEIPEEVTISCINTVTKKNIVYHPIACMKKIVNRVIIKYKKMSYLEQNRISSEMLLPIQKKYDIAIAYHAPNTVPMFYVIDKIRAEKKILWLHGGMENNEGSSALSIKYHSKYDKVFAVSKDVYKSFLKYHPDMKSKVEIFYNYVDIESVKKKAKEGKIFQDKFNGIRILTIGRLDRQKGIDMAIDVCQKLIQHGYNIRWYVCGEGEERKGLEELIDRANLKKEFILMGNKNNPYGYLLNCDIYIQTSRCEGFCTTTNEARMLYKPVITTEVSGAKEQFVDGTTGWIVPINKEKILEKVEWCLQHPRALQVISENLKKVELQSSENINKIFE